MAYSMYLQGEGFDRKGWLSELKSTYIENPESVRTPLSGLFHQVVDLEEGIDCEQLWLHPRDGIRGVTVWQRDGRVELSLPTGASETDFILAGDLISMGIRHGGEGRSEEHDSLQGTDEEISEISRRAREFFFSAIRDSADGEDLTLPVGGFLHLQVSAADVGHGFESLEKVLTERMRRYSAAYLPSQMTLRTKEGRTFTLSNYGHMPSLIDSETELIATQGDDGPLCPEPIPAAHFFAVLGERIENLGKFIYVPAIDFKAEPELATALGNFSRTESGSQPSGELTGDDWALLAKAPCLVFLMVAAADGSVDKKEMALFGALLQKHADVPLPVFSKVLKIAFANLEHMVNELLQSDVPALVQLIAVRALLDSGKFRPEEAADIAKGLYALGRAVASASGGFLGIGSKISKKESEVLDLIEKLLLR